MPINANLNQPNIQRPSRWSYYKEPLGLMEVPKLLIYSRQLKDLPHGNQQPIMVIPGYAASDMSTFILRQFLKRKKYRVRGWGLGRNKGHVEEVIIPLREQVLDYHAEIQEPLILIGWSLGGYLAREIARDYPEMISQVITLGSPIIGGPKYTSAAPIYEKKGFNLDEMERKIVEREEVPITTPITAIYSKNDGVVPWQACMDHYSPNVEHTEVSTTHVGLAFSSEVFVIIAGKLAD